MKNAPEAERNHVCMVMRSELTAPVHGVVSFAGDEPMTYENTAVLKLIREE